MYPLEEFVEGNTFGLDHDESLDPSLGPQYGDVLERALIASETGHPSAFDHRNVPGDDQERVVVVD